MAGAVPGVPEVLQSLDQAGAGAAGHLPEAAAELTRPALDLTEPADPRWFARTMTAIRTLADAVTRGSRGARGGRARPVRVRPVRRRTADRAVLRPGADGPGRQGVEHGQGRARHAGSAGRDPRPRRTRPPAGRGRGCGRRGRRPTKAIVKAGDEPGRGLVTGALIRPRRERLGRGRPNRRDRVRADRVRQTSTTAGTSADSRPRSDPGLVSGGPQAIGEARRTMSWGPTGLDGGGWAAGPAMVDTGASTSRRGGRRRPSARRGRLGGGPPRAGAPGWAPPPGPRCPPRGAALRRSWTAIEHGLGDVGATDRPPSVRPNPKRARSGLR